MWTRSAGGRSPRRAAPRHNDVTESTKITEITKGFVVFVVFVIFVTFVLSRRRVHWYKRYLARSRRQRASA